MPQLRQCLESAACWSSGSAWESSPTPKYTAPSCPRPRSATSGSSALSTKRLRGRRLPRPPRARPSGRPASPARRSGRAGRGRGWTAGRRAATPGDRGSHASSTSNRPSWPRPSPRVEQRGGHAPAHVRARRGCARRPARPPRGSPRPWRRWWSSRWWPRSDRALGPARAPCARIARGRRAAAAARAGGAAAAAQAARERAHGAGGPRVRLGIMPGRPRAGSAATVIGHGVGDRVAVGVHAKPAVGVHVDLARRAGVTRSAHPGGVPLNTFGSLIRKRS